MYVIMKRLLTDQNYFVGTNAGIVNYAIGVVKTNP